jgi:NhaP-type Na+/H+ or K+/H+ antiporter
VTHHVALTIALAFAAGMTVQCAARSLRVPAIILLLAAGVALGPEGLGWVEPHLLGDGLFILVDFAVAIILFEGGLNLRLDRLRREQRAIRRLVTWGALVTLIGGGVAARYWLGWSWPMALLFGSLVVVTGPTVVSPLVRHLRLHTRPQTILEAEGVLIDPIGALLAVLVLQVTLAPDPFAVAGEFGGLLGRIAIGAICGVVGGLVIAGALRLPAFVHGFENALTLALVVLLFHASDALVAPSGLLAVTVAGLVVGNVKSPMDDDLREFKDQLTVLMIGVVFILLAADIAVGDIWALGLSGVGVLATLMLVVRPASVWISTVGTGLSWREQVFLAAIAPRGIVAAAIASLTARAISGEAAAQSAELRALVFLVIAGTVVTAGVVALPLASLLRLRRPRRDRVAVLGAQGLGMAAAQALQTAGQSVVVLDADPQRCRQAEQAGLTVVYGNALQERTLLRVPIEDVGTALGATFNDNLNSQFVGLARHTFGVGRGLVSVQALDGGKVPEHVRRNDGDVLFEGPHDQEQWDVRWRHRDVDLVNIQYSGPHTSGTTNDATVPASQELFVILTHVRAGKVQAMSLALAQALKIGDAATAAVYRREHEAALEMLQQRGWVLAPDTSSPPAEDETGTSA